MTGSRAERWIALAAVAILLPLIHVSAMSTPCPVLLVYGFQPLPGFRTTQLWEDFAECLSGNTIANTQTLEVSKDHEFYYLPAANEHQRDVYLSNYCFSYEPSSATPWAASSLALTQKLATSMTFLGQTCSEIMESTTAGKSEPLSCSRRPTTAPSSPLLGSGSTPSASNWLLSPSSCGFSTSEFLRLLNTDTWIDGSLTSLNPTIRYVALAGQTCLGCGLRADEDACLQACVAEALSWNGSDLVIMMASAYLPEAENCAMIGFDHVQNHTDVIIARAIEAILNGEPTPAAIYAPKLQALQPD